jgi:hypothetical protein
MSNAAALPSTQPEKEVIPDFHYEVVDGQFVETPRMGAFESVIASILQSYLGPFAKEKELGRVATETLFVEVDPILWTEIGPSLATLSPASRPATLG